MSSAGSDVVMEGEFSIWPQQSTIKGGIRLNVRLPCPSPDGSLLHLHFSTDTTTDTTNTANTTADTTDTTDTANTTNAANRILRGGIDDVHVVELIRDEAQINVYYATVPGCATPGACLLSLQCTDSSGHQSILYTTQFTYTPHDHQDITEQLLQHINKGLPLQSELIPPLESQEELVQLDRCLTTAVQGLEWPLQWKVSLDSGDGGGSIANAPQTTLLHLASHHNLMSLARHLVTLPGVHLALYLPDEQGFTPMDVARNVGNMDIMKLFTATLLQSSVTGGDLSSEGSSKRNSQDDLLRFREINEEWRGQIKRHKISSSSMGLTNFNPEISSVNPKDRLPTPPLPQTSPSTPSRAPTSQRRKSIAVMEPGQRHVITAQECLQINVKDPELAMMERQRKQSWSIVVGDAESRSVDTGLNELDRVTATDRVQQCKSAMQGDLEASQEGQVTGDSHLNPSRLNLLYCCSLSCPLLTEDTESGTGTNSLLASARTSPGPDIGSDHADSPPLHPRAPLISTSVSVADELSEAGPCAHADTLEPNAHSPTDHRNTQCVRVPQVITTRYSTEELKIVSQSHDRLVDGECIREHDNRMERKILRSDLPTVNQEEEEEEGEEDLCHTVSAPHLRGNGGDEETDEEKEGGSVGGKSNGGQIEKEESTGFKKTKREVVFRNSHAIQEIKHFSGSGSSDSLTPIIHGRRSHRRSQSMSVVELGSPPLEKKCDGDDGVTVKGLRRNRGSSTLKPTSPGLADDESSQSPDQHSSASASRSNSIKGGDSRSRASSLMTDVSSMHESGESSDNETMSGMSGTSLEGIDAPNEASVATPTIDDTEQHCLKLPKDSPDGPVMLRPQKGRSKVPQEYRYSADISSTYKDELESNSVLSAAGTRRLKSESSDKRKEISLEGDDSTEKKRVVSDSVFDQDVTLSDVDVKIQSDDSLSMNYECMSPDKPSPHTTSSKSSKSRLSKSPLVKRRSQTVKEKSPPPPKLQRGLTKQDVSPVIGKLRMVLNSQKGSEVIQNSHEPHVSDDEETLKGSPVLLSEEQTTTPESTSLDRAPRSPQMTKISDRSPPSSSRHRVSPLSYQQQNEPPNTSSPPLSPPSPSIRHHARRSTSPHSINPDDSKAPVSKPNAVSSFFRGNRKLKSMSLDGSPSSVKDIMNVKNRMAETLQEENGEEEEEMAEDDKEDEKGGNLVRDHLRMSKSRNKAMTILGGGPEVERALNECFSKSGGSGGTGAIRAKSAKTRPKLDNVFFPESTKSSQAVENTNEQGGDERTNKRGSPRKLTTDQRRGSDSSLVTSPTHSNFDHSLSVVDELPQANLSNVPLTSDPNHLSPAPVENTSDSDREDVTQQLARSMSESYPELEIKEDRNWERTIDRRVLRKMNKHERDRQNIIHELIQTEHHHYRSLHVLKLVFKEQMSQHLSEESIAIMFPQLDSLIEISKSFVDRLEDRRGKEGANVIIDDVSDILLEEFTAGNRERILHSFGEFCTYHLIAAEMYKEQLKKKHFGRLVQQLYRLKECQRLYLPDYYTSVSQRLTKMVQFLQRLVKKTETLKLAHTDRLKQCQQELEKLVTAVDRYVDSRKNQLELRDIQDKLEIISPRSSAKDSLWNAVKDLNLTAQSRRLLKRGDAQLIHGHGKQLSVHVVLVTDLIVLLTERDQKYNIPAPLDLKPPVIRLYDLHARVNVSVKSGIQLLLMEGGSVPEMFRLEFKSKKEAKAWEATLINAVDVCKEKGIKCEYFGSEPVIVEEKKGSEEETKRSPRVRRSESQRSAGTPPSQNPTVRRILSARASLEAANRVLSMFVTSSSSTADLSVSPRHPPPPSRYNQSPKNRHNTISQLSAKFTESGTLAGDRESQQTVSEVDGSNKKTHKLKTKRKGLDRSSTFKGRGEDKKEKDRGGGIEAVDTSAHQQLVICALGMRESLEDMLKDYEEKEKEIERLKQELKQARQEAAAATAVPAVIVQRKLSPNGSPHQFRPHSYHVDVNDMSGSLSQPASTEEDKTSTGLTTPLFLTQEPPDTGT